MHQLVIMIVLTVKHCTGKTAIFIGKIFIQCVDDFFLTIFFLETILKKNFFFLSFSLEK